MFSLILYKIWFWVALYYEFYILRVMGYRDFLVVGVSLLFVNLPLFL
jgi:hypothetical protein